VKVISFEWEPQTEEGKEISYEEKDVSKKAN
jgi:hypothetical protein